MFIAVGIAGSFAIAVAVGIAILRAYYHAYAFWFTWPHLQPGWYPYHPLAWDYRCSLPFDGLDRLLSGYTELHPEAGKREIERLIDHFPSQRMSALKAKAQLIARAVGRESNLARIALLIADMPEGEEGFLKFSPQIRLLVGEIAQLQARLDTIDRPFLREPTAALLCEKIKNFQNQVVGYPEPLASEFRQAAAAWLTIAEAQRENKIQTLLSCEPHPQVFRAGDPVVRGNEAFVPRELVLGDIDRQLTLATGCPGLILYARRRMGKSTLLSNLEGLVPTSTRIAVVSMQNPDAFTSQDDFIQLLRRQIKAADLGITTETSNTLPAFFKLLENSNSDLEKTNRRLVLAIDEYENIDVKLGQGVFSEDLLATIRESIQYHRRIVWAFAGSHAIEELTHAPWPSYLISARTIEIPPFSEAETYRLLTEPLRFSALWEKDDPKRPRFEPGFWGEGGIERIHREAGGWPHLVQLLAETAVDLSNDRERQRLDADLLEQAINKAVTLGDTVLRQLLKGEASEAEWTYLRGFLRRDTQPPPDEDDIHRNLRRRLLVEDAGNGEWRLRVPLMQRWLRERS